MVSPRIGVVFVHGFLSSAKVWERFRRLINEDPDLHDIAVDTFAYRSPVMALHPLRRIPHLDDVADGLRAHLSTHLADFSHLALVTHSQGGLVAQRALARALTDGDDRDLDRLRLIVMYACPHAGSDLGLPWRRRLRWWRNPQERELRPLRPAVTEAQRTVLNRIVHGKEKDIAIRVYAGDSDAVVPPTVARGVFPHADTLPGDHSSLIQPDSPSHPSYVVLKRDLRAVLAQLDGPPAAPRPRPAPPQRSSPARPERTGPDTGRPDTGPDTTGDGSTGDGSTGDGSTDQRTTGHGASAGSESARAAFPPAALSARQRARVVDSLFAVQRMYDPAFRQLLYGMLPDPVQAQLPHHPVPRTELIGVTGALEAHRHLGTWDALADALDYLLPEHSAVAEVIALLMELGLIAPRPAGPSADGGP